MTWWWKSNPIKHTRSAAVIAALLCFGLPALAQNITLRSSDGGVEVSGQFLAYDGDFLTLRTEAGVATMRYSEVQCTGSACPSDDYAPVVRVVGSPGAAALVFPALIEAYARDAGLALSEEDGIFILNNDGRPHLTISLGLETLGDGLDAFAQGKAEMLLAARSLRDEERARIRRLGLGDVTSSRQMRIVALDALVPVAPAGSDHRQVSLRALADILSGQVRDWSALQSGPAPLSLHLLGPEDALTDAMLDRFLAGLGMQVRGDVIWHISPEDLQRALLNDPGALGVLPLSQTGTAQPLAISGSCGVQSVARFLGLKTEDYPLTFPLYLYLPNWRQHPDVMAFLTWMRSASAQLVVRRSGLVDLSGTPIPVQQQGDRLSNAILGAGSEIPLTELQRMMRVLTPRVRMSNTFRFEPGSTRLDGPSRSSVMLLAQAIRNSEYVGRELLLVGFSDGRGPAEANRDLSSARAESVRRDVLAALGGELPFGVALETEAFGEALPIACDDTLWGQQANRRVELWVRDLP